MLPFKSLRQRFIQPTRRSGDQDLINPNDSEIMLFELGVSFQRRQLNIRHSNVYSFEIPLYSNVYSPIQIFITKNQSPTNRR